MTDEEIDERWAQLGADGDDYGAWTGAMWQQWTIDQASPLRPVMQVIVETVADWLAAGWPLSDPWGANVWFRDGWDADQALAAIRMGIRSKPIRDLTDEETERLWQALRKVP